MGSRSPLYRYGVALLATSVALAFQLLLEPLLELESPFVVFLAAVMFSAWYGGKGAGILTTLITLLLSLYFFLSPLRSFEIDSIGEGVRMIIYTSEGILLSFLIPSLQSARRKAERNLYSLQESEEQFRQLAENIREVFWMADPQQQRVLYVSPAYEQLWGRSRQLLYRNPENILEPVHPEDQERVVAASQRQKQGQNTLEEYRIIQPDGTMRWISDRAFPIENQHGQVYRVAGIAEDITERKEAERALRDSEERYRAFLEQSAECIWRFELERPLSIEWEEERQIQHLYEFGYLAECNQATAQMYGFSAVEEVVGMRLTAFLVRSDPRNTRYLLNFMRSGYRLNDVESREVDNQGQARYLLNNLVGIVEDGALLRIWGSQRDITEHKRNQMLLSTQNQVLEMVAAGVALPDLLITLTRAIEEQSDGAMGVILLLNPEGTQLLPAAAPSLPPGYRQVLAAGIPIGEREGSCGTAAYLHETVVISDIAKDPLCEKYRDIALANGLQACWSQPILSSGGEVLGVFSLYYNTSRQPNPYERKLVAISTHLAGIAIERQHAEAALRDSEERLRLALKAGEMGIWDWNMLTHDLNWSDSLERMHGMAPGSFDRKFATFVKTIYAEDQKAVRRAIAQATSQKSSYDVEYRVLWADGSIHWQASKGQVFHDEMGQAIRMIGVAMDITDRKQAEGERIQLLEREQQAREEVELQRSYLHSLLMQAPAFICIQRGPDHTYEFVNDLYQKLMGDRNLIGKSVHEALPDFREQGFFELLDRVYQTGQPYFGKEVLASFDRDGDGTLQDGFFNFVYQPMYGIDGTIQGVMTFAFEVTDHVLSRQQSELLAKHLRNQQRALKESEERYRTLIEATYQITWNTKADGEFAREQPSWNAFTGQTFEESKGWGWLNVVHPEDQSHTASIWTTSLATRTLYDVEHRLRRHDGEYRYMSVRAVPVIELDGNIREWVGVHADITERKRAEAEREELLAREQDARTEAEAASRMKDEFLATLSHELRTPLNAMLGWTQLLRTREFDAATANRALETLDRNSRTLAQLIDDVLDVSRIVRGKLRLEVRSVQLGGIVRAAIDTLRPAMDAKTIQIDLQEMENEVTVMGDANRLQQVVWNLLSNAIKFTPKGGQIQVWVGITESLAQIRVKDTGQGISPDFLPYVFDRFRQGDGSITRSHSGLGLGLSIVRHLVELHGGTVSAESPGVGQGAIFVVSLPVRALRVSSKDEIAHHLPSLEDLPIEALPISLEGLRVLVVDDEADARELLTAVLAEYGAEVAAAASVTIALEVLASFRPNVLVSDIGMPGEDGYSLIRKIRTLETQQKDTLPAVALTAYASPQDRIRALQAGFNLHAPKPISPVELVTVVARLAGRIDH